MLPGISVLLIRGVGLIPGWQEWNLVRESSIEGFTCPPIAISGGKVNVGKAEGEEHGSLLHGEEGDLHISRGKQVC